MDDDLIRQARKKCNYCEKEEFCKWCDNVHSDWNSCMDPGEETYTCMKPENELMVVGKYGHCDFYESRFEADRVRREIEKSKMTQKQRDRYDAGSIFWRDG